jgi:hypothetical protein
VRVVPILQTPKLLEDELLVAMLDAIDETLDRARLLDDEVREDRDETIDDDDNEEDSIDDRDEETLEEMLEGKATLLLELAPAIVAVRLVTFALPFAINPNRVVDPGCKVLFQPAEVKR